MDEFSLSLFTNPDILRCDQNGVIGRLSHRDGKLDVWKTPQRGNENNGWIGLFNRDGGKDMSFDLGTAPMGLAPGKSYALENIWTGETLPAAGKYLFEILAEGVVFLSYRKSVDLEKRSE
jgi:alpha-galactosidase